jgi:hypothetical protein
LSVEWYKEKVDIPICDRCLLDILRAREDIVKRDLETVRRHIENLEKKIKP